MAATVKIGISSTVLREHPVSYALDQIAAAGYHSAEIWLWHLEQSGEQPGPLAQQARALGLALTVHAPTTGVNALSVDSQTADPSQNRILAAMETAADLEASVIVVHPGALDEPGLSTEAFWERLLAWAGALDERAVALGIEVGLELMEKLPDEVFCLPADAARLMVPGYRVLGLTVDLAHAHTHMPPPDFLARLDPAWIRHVHLSDSGPEKVHMPLGEGEMDIERALRALPESYDGLVSIEGSIPGRGEELLARNIDFLRGLGAV